MEVKKKKNRWRRRIKWKRKRGLWRMRRVCETEEDGDGGMGDGQQKRETRAVWCRRGRLDLCVWREQVRKTMEECRRRRGRGGCGGVRVRAWRTDVDQPEDNQMTRQMEGDYRKTEEKEPVFT